MTTLAAATALADAYTTAWNSGRAAAVAEFFAPDGSIAINGGTPWKGRGGVAEMAQGFFADFPDLTLINDGIRLAGIHAVYMWTFTGTHQGSGNRVRVSGWEEWDLAGDGAIAASRGWFDEADYAAQTTVA